MVGRFEKEETKEELDVSKHQKLLDRKETQKRWYIKNKENTLKKCKQYREKNKEKIRKNAKQYRIDNRERLLSIARERYVKRKQFIINYKLSKGCSVCGYNKCFAALDFHHNNDKEFNIGLGACRNIERLKKEMAKCIILCSNCHRELHEKNKDVI